MPIAVFSAAVLYSLNHVCVSDWVVDYSLRLEDRSALALRIAWNLLYVLHGVDKDLTWTARRHL